MSGPEHGGGVIELGQADSWVPEETPRPRRGLSGPGRLVLAMLVLAVAVAVPVRSEPALGALLHIGTGGSAVTLGGGRIYVIRAGQGLEVYSAHGARLWTRTLSEAQQLDYGTAGATVIGGRGGPGAALDTVTVLDPGTGAERWTRSGVAAAGRAGRLVVLLDTSQWRADPPLPPVHLIAVDESTGAPVWDVQVPDGSMPEYAHAGDISWDLTSLTVLDPDGTLREYDLGTGAVARTSHLQRPGGPIGSVTLGPGGRQVAVAGTEVGAGEQVYDRATGRLLWQVDDREYRLDPCAPQLWCRPDGGKLLAYDAATGREAWRVDGFDTVLAAEGGALALGSLGRMDAVTGATVLVVDARTGAVRARLDGWHPVPVQGGGVVVWHRPEGELTATVGLLNPASGAVAVSGTGDGWGGQPSCAADDRIVACGVAGDLTAWPRPAAARP
ncbi:PQQ-binding-like beta-propeller repeat protein [Dactylosporangium vinaceum]|uniref:PQQ-binding-like beta-propeller repeat protein n=1 Tax=Dactylosporangium vinaceum TaxID=53362 RepID=A0ABV5MBD5_9ACTN|nr:PQQ-binding-like beta-propeller repeat protein [Dactylosporangium vinaceum]UAB98256.1 PQQ-binding-like beta-propeller repeat protein [Dactylosporangium vinaceum]